jgi:SAM-dependent methyltransferase
MNAAQLPEQYVTRPGTPMAGPYSTNQMDDFYAALSRGEAKPSGLMNLLQHLIVAEQCAPNSRVLDVCCGRGLALPLLYRYAPKIGGYVGLDISAANLDEARERIEALRATYGDPFPVELVECDVAQPWPALPSFDIALYTSALEHLPFELGAASLRNTAAALLALYKRGLSGARMPRREATGGRSPSRSVQGVIETGLARVQSEYAEHLRAPA